MRTAPVVIVPLSSKAAYLDRYAEPDKGWTDREERRWPVPYWHIDTGMATLLILQTAVDEGLGACFFGIPRDRVDCLLRGVRRARVVHADRRGHGRPPHRRRRRRRLARRGARAGRSTRWCTAGSGEAQAGGDVRCRSQRSVPGATPRSFGVAATGATSSAASSSRDHLSSW